MKAKSLAGAAALVAVGLLGAAPAGATTHIIHLGNVTDPFSGGGFSQPLTITSKGQFDYDFQFDVTGPIPDFYISVSETNTTPRGRNGIQHGVLGLDSGLAPHGTLLAFDDITPYPSTGSQSANINYALLLPTGNYYVELSGTESGATSYAIHIGTTVTATGAVPESSSWIMFGLGLAGLVTLGMAKRRKEARYTF
jgi:hypothetical protein